MSTARVWEDRGFRSRRAWHAALAAGLGLLVGAGPAQADGPGNTPERYVAFRVGADVGISGIAGQTYWQLNANGLLRLGPLRTDFYVPLRFSMDGFRFREEDYRDARDFLRIPRCVRLDLGDHDRTEDRHDPTCDVYRWREGLHERMYLTARLSPLRDVSFGHGTLVADLNNSLDPNRPQLGAQLQGILRDLGEVRAFLDDVTDPRLLAANVVLRPLQVIGQNWDETPDDLVVRAGLVRDFAAPLRVHSAFGQPLRDAEGRFQQTTTALTALSADVHYLYLWLSCAEEGSNGCESSRDVGLFAFADYNRFLEVPDADGLHGGVHFRFRQRDRYRTFEGRELAGNGRMFDTWEVSVGGEGRWMGNRYLPGYFDGNYAVQSQQFAFSDAARAQLGADAPTTSKLEYLLSRPDGRTWGWQAYLRVHFPIPMVRGSAPSRLPLTLWVEDAGAPLSTSTSAVLGPFRMDQAIVAAQFLRRNFNGFGDVLSLDGALIRVMGAMFLSSSQSQRANDSLLNGLMLGLSYSRRYMILPNGQLDAANDFLVTLGTSLGVN